jgi:hypothetical protein
MLMSDDIKRLGPTEHERLATGCCCKPFLFMNCVDMGVVMSAFRFLRQYLAAFLLCMAASLALAAAKPRSDFFGTGTSDLLWRNGTTGQVYVMPMKAGVVQSGTVIWTEPNPAWQIVAVADFDGDGKADILWRNSSTGQVYQMQMAGTAIKAAAMIYSEPNTAWQIVGTGDFDGDGKADILWRNSTTGAVYLMPMNGTTVLPGSVIYTESNPDWQIVAVADFDGDNKADLLWWNSASGQVFQMLMNGTMIRSQQLIYTEADTAWKIVGTGDFNGDGKADILWRNASTGVVYMMFMNGPAIQSGAIVYTEANPAWQIVSLGDFNGDGEDDILWRNSATGQVYQMLMNGMAIAGGSTIHNEPNAAWTIQAETEWRNRMYPVVADSIAVLPGNQYFTFATGVIDGGMPSEIMYNDVDGYLMLPHASAQKTSQAYSAIRQASYGVYLDSNNGAPIDRFSAAPGTVYMFRSSMFGAAPTYYKLEILSSSKRPSVGSSNYGVVTFKYSPILPMVTVNAVGRWLFPNGSELSVLTNKVMLDYKATDGKFYTIKGDYLNSSTLVGDYTTWNPDNSATTGSVTVTMVLGGDGTLSASLAGDPPLGSATLGGGVKQ